jgi:hypothetical protein
MGQVDRKPGFYDYHGKRSLQARPHKPLRGSLREPLTVCDCGCGETFTPIRSNQLYVDSRHRLKKHNRRWPLIRISSKLINSIKAIPGVDPWILGNIVEILREVGKTNAVPVRL